MVLAATLKDLIEDGIVDRKSFDEIPPRVEYTLTSKGKSVVPILQSICQWSDVFYKEDGKKEMVQHFKSAGWVAGCILNEGAFCL